MKQTVSGVVFLLAGAGAAVAAPSGKALFDNNCAFCHQAGGAGVPGQFPRLEDRAGQIASKPEGRDFLITVLLNGMSGHINVDGQDIMGLMPSFSTQSDDELSATLNYIVRLGKTKAKPFTPKDIAAVRSRPMLTPGDVTTRRAILVTNKIVP